MRCSCSGGVATRSPSVASTVRGHCRSRRIRGWSNAPSTAKNALGDRVFVLGHHYQRDEVIAFADVTGDFQARSGCRRATRCRIHRLLRRALHGRIGRHPHRPQPARRTTGSGRWLLDGRHGRLPAGARRLGRADRCGCRESHGSGHLHELDGRHQRVYRCPWRNRMHVIECRTRAALGTPAWREGAVPARPAPGSQHGGARAGPVPVRLRRVRPTPSGRWPVRRSAAGLRP